MPGAWDTLFTLTSIGRGDRCSASLILVARRRTGDYLGRLVARLDRLTGRRLEASRIVKFILDVEDVLLALLRGDRRRLVILTVLPIVCYFVMAFEVWLVLWAVGEPIGIMAALTIETFARLAASRRRRFRATSARSRRRTPPPVAMLGLGGGGALALARRIRSLLWAGLGLALYPQVKSQPAVKRELLARGT